MLKTNKLIATTASALLASATVIGAAQAQATNDDHNGDVLIKPDAEVSAEASAEAPVVETKDMVGDMNGEEPLTLKQQQDANAEAMMDAADDLPKDGTKDMVGELQSDDPDAELLIQEDQS